MLKGLMEQSAQGQLRIAARPGNLQGKHKQAIAGAVGTLPVDTLPGWYTARQV